LKERKKEGKKGKQEINKIKKNFDFRKGDGGDSEFSPWVSNEIFLGDLSYFVLSFDFLSCFFSNFVFESSVVSVFLDFFFFFSLPGVFGVNGVSGESGGESGRGCSFADL